jgi:hypothetical protein
MGGVIESGGKRDFADRPAVFARIGQALATTLQTPRQKGGADRAASFLKRQM